MKTPIQEVLETYEVMLSLHPEMAVSVRSVVEDLKSHLEKEKEVMCEFAFRFNHDAFTENYIKAEFEETFNTKEK